MNCLMGDFDELLMQGSQSYAQTLAEYCRLALSPELTDEQADRLEEIYQQAEKAPVLNFFINELDYLLGQRIGVLDEVSVADYKNQQAWLREHLEEMPLDRDNRIEIQSFLQEHGFYDGPIDGVLGDRSARAVEQFLKEAQKLLREKGFYDGEVDGEFGNRSLHAVIEFQKSQRLEEDGVLGRKTFSALRKA